MRALICVSILSAVLAAAALPVYGGQLTFTLDAFSGSGSPMRINPDPNFCSAPNCVLFTGTLTDNDSDLSLLIIDTPHTGALDGITFAGALNLDNTGANNVPGVLSGDPNWATDGLGNPPNVYVGPIFAVDIPARTPVGTYTDTVYIDVTPTNDNQPFTVSEQVTVYVTPEPGSAGLMLVGALGAWFGARRRWHSRASSR